MSGTGIEGKAAAGELRAFGEAYGYDIGYLEELLERSPRAFAAFQAAQGMSQFREALPLDAHFAARIGAMQSEDCGACGQLNLKMAVEAGVDRELLGTLLESPTRLPEPLADVYQHALESALDATPDPSRAQRLREQYGDAGFAELAVVITGCRIYPGLKRALARDLACEPLTLDF